MSDRFIVHRLRAKPVEYSVALRHYVAGGEYMFSVTVKDVVIDGSLEQARRVVSDLRRAADLIEADAREGSSEP